MNFVEVKQFTELEHFNYDSMLKKNKSVAGTVQLAYAPIP
jgi:hypothetical protein